MKLNSCFFFFSSRRRHTRFDCDWSSDVCSSDLSQTLSGRTFIPQILASTASEQDIAAAQEEIHTLLLESHKADDFTVKNQADLAAAAESSTKVMTLLLAAIASISLLVGGIGIMNIMLVSVTER